MHTTCTVEYICTWNNAACKVMPARTEEGRRGRIGAEKLSPLKVGKLALTLKKLQSP